MKTTLKKLIASSNIPASLIRAVVRPLAPLFECKSCDPKHNAQRNLDGRSYFVCDENLRFHKSKVLSSRAFADGLLFKVTDSNCAFDEWAETFGYDTDSRKALATYESCRAAGPKLRALGLSREQIARFAALSSML